MAMFRTRFWELLSEKEARDKRRYNNVSELSDLIGVSRVTFYKYADEEMKNVEGKTVKAFMEFLGLSDVDLPRFLFIENSQQLYAQKDSDTTSKTILA